MKVFVFFIIVYLFVLKIKKTKSDLSKEAYNHKDEKSFTDKKFVLKTLSIESIIFSICSAFVLLKNYSFILNVLSFIQIITVHMLFNIGFAYIYFFMLIFH